MSEMCSNPSIAAQVHERAEVGERTNRPAHHRTFLQSFERGLLRALLEFFQNHAPVDHQILGFFVELGDPAFNLLPHELGQIRPVADAAARSRHKRAHADIDAQPALDRFGDRAGDGALVGERRFEPAPVFGTLHAYGGQQVVAFARRGPLPSRRRCRPS